MKANRQPFWVRYLHLGDATSCPLSPKQHPTNNQQQHQHQHNSSKKKNDNNISKNKNDNQSNKINPNSNHNNNQQEQLNRWNPLPSNWPFAMGCSSGSIMPWHAPNSSRIGFSLRRQTIRCCCLEDLVRCWWSGQNQSSQKHATFWEMYGDSRFRISGTLPTLNLGWSAVTKGSMEAGFHEVFLLYILYGLGCSPSLAATVSTSNCFAFLVGDPYWPEGVASQCMWSLCFFFWGWRGWFVDTLRRVNWCPRHVNSAPNLAWLVSSIGILLPSFMSYGIWQAGMRISFHQPNVLQCHKAFQELFVKLIM